MSVCCRQTAIEARTVQSTGLHKTASSADSKDVHPRLAFSDHTIDARYIGGRANDRAKDSSDG